MFSGGDSGGVETGYGATSALSHSQYYFYYQCNHTVSITSSPSSEIACPNCSSGFLEEVENPIPNPVTNAFFSFASFADDIPPFSIAFGSVFPLVFSTSSSASGGGGRVDPHDLSALFGGRRSSFQDSGEFNPFNFLQDYLQNMRAGGANIQLVIENSGHDSFPRKLIYFP